MSEENVPAHMPKVITELYAWICREPDGGDGIPAIRLPDGTAMPLIGSDKVRIESLRPAAMDVRLMNGYPVKLVRFSNMEVVEEL